MTRPRAIGRSIGGHHFQHNYARAHRRFRVLSPETSERAISFPSSSSSSSSFRPSVPACLAATDGGESGQDQAAAGSSSLSLSLPLPRGFLLLFSMRRPRRRPVSPALAPSPPSPPSPSMPLRSARVAGCENFPGHFSRPTVLHKQNLIPSPRSQHNYLKTLDMFLTFLHK